MILTGIARLGRDAELRNLQDGGVVASLALAFNYGRKGSDGSRESQWIESSLWGKQAENLAQYLVKGTQLSVIIGDPHIEIYEKREGGQGFKMVGKIINIEFAGGSSAPKPVERSKIQNTSQDNFNDDLPF
jgi:single-strand DNA-binding protein